MDLVESTPQPSLVHSFFKPLLPLIKSLAQFLVLDRHWLDPSDKRNEPDYLNEVYQRLILAFILENRDKEFMDHPIDNSYRKVEQRLWYER
jgi:hypothetical protein